jgi:hypothetical protein
VSEALHCPHCGAPLHSAGQIPDGLDSLYQEIRRIREIAESRPPAPSPGTPDPARVAELTREVAELRATVARLRGAGQPS